MSEGLNQIYCRRSLDMKPKLSALEIKNFSRNRKNIDASLMGAERASLGVGGVNT